MADDGGAYVPFNFFAGASPTSAINLAWQSGYLYGITSILLSTGSDTATNLRIYDAEGNLRIVCVCRRDAAPDYSAVFSWTGLLVLGPNEGAQLAADNDLGVVSVDGWALAPLSSSIW
jgi:hypothetical protein